MRHTQCRIVFFAEKIYDFQALAFCVIHSRFRSAWASFFIYITNKGVASINHLPIANCDLAFEYSDVYAEITGHVDSVKNPRSGKIILDHVGEIIREDPVMPRAGEVIVRAGANRL